ncbi:MAG: cobalt-precorrin-6A reductase [Selenomonadaceae bacterium]|nr:cobalt-precorrin-6A reductase [Selenomonadaceae bacterium]
MNKKIFVVAGTQDGRELAGFLHENGYKVIASVVSKYGEELLKQYEGIEINDKPLDSAGLTEFIAKNNISLLVDASHPYAANASQNAMKACHNTKIPYIRYERKQTVLDYEKAYYVENYAEASKKASELGKNIFLTTGSRNLEAFTASPYLKDCKLTCRVLPEPEVVLICRNLGFLPESIIAMQGPFSKLMNLEMYKKYEADVVITKNSGFLGGTDTKVEAAMELNLPLIIIDRPKVQYDNVTDNYDDVLAFVRKEL